MCAADICDRDPIMTTSYILTPSPGPAAAAAFSQFPACVIHAVVQTKHPSDPEAQRSYLACEERELSSLLPARLVALDKQTRDCGAEDITTKVNAGCH